MVKYINSISPIAKVQNKTIAIVPIRYWTKFFILLSAWKNSKMNLSNNMSKKKIYSNKKI